MEEQWVMGRMVHLLKANTADQQYMVSAYTHTHTLTDQCYTGITSSEIMY